MANTSDILGQSKPSSGVLTDLYEVPAGKGCITCGLTAANQSSSDDTVLVTLAKAGAVDDASQVVVPTMTVSGNSYLPIGIPLGLGPGDVVRVKSTNGTTSFNLTGVEMTRT